MSDGDQHQIFSSTASSLKLPFSKKLEILVRSKRVKEGLEVLFFMMSNNKSKRSSSLEPPEVPEEDNYLDFLSRYDPKSISLIFQEFSLLEKTIENETRPSNQPLPNSIFPNSVNTRSEKKVSDESTNLASKTQVFSIPVRTTGNMTQTQVVPAGPEPPFDNNKAQNTDRAQDSEQPDSLSSLHLDSPAISQKPGHLHETQNPFPGPEPEDPPQQTPYPFQAEEQLTTPKENPISRPVKKPQANENQPRTSDQKALGPTKNIVIYEVTGLARRQIANRFGPGTITLIDSFVSFQAGTRRENLQEIVYFVAVLDQTNGKNDKNYKLHMIDIVSGVIQEKQLADKNTDSTLLYFKPVINQTALPNKNYSRILLRSVELSDKTQDKPILISDIDLVSQDQKVCYKIGLRKSCSKSVFMVRQNTTPGTGEFEFFLMALDLHKMYYSRITCDENWKTETQKKITSLDFSEYSSFNFLAANFDYSFRDSKDTHIVVMLVNDSECYKFLIVKASTKFSHTEKHKTDLVFESMLNTKIPIPFSSESGEKYVKNAKFTEVFVSTGLKFIAVGGVFPKLDLTQKESDPSNPTELDLLIIYLNVSNEEGVTEQLSNRPAELFLPDDRSDQMVEKNKTYFGKFNSLIEVTGLLSKKELRLQMAHVEFIYKKHLFLLTLYGVTHTSELGCILAFKEQAIYSYPTLRVYGFKPQSEPPVTELLAIDKTLKIEVTENAVNLVFAVALNSNELELVEFKTDISASLESALGIENNELGKQRMENRRRMEELFNQAR